ncbi:hypothetical protein [Streptomyces chryseus]|uniref:DUF4232 domain-containing protein n=2 Tax=Streptomyces chryseus TaxID=68186 RepID=A0ABQ3E1Q8_9ACTN|nr:hypothetical protein [Streptomyces chryseus]GHB22144.1 hypothetical protein GCM10010346_52260 [Streptomyces chryseus]
MSGKQERHGPDGPLNDLTGKAIVNDGPNKRENRDEPEAEPTVEPDTEPTDEQSAEPDIEQSDETAGPEAAGPEPDAETPDAASISDAILKSMPAADSAPDSDATPKSDPGTDSDLDDFGTDELALRRMLRGAVEELEPSRNALDHLRKAVPARRARRRQAVVGMAAAALFVGMAVPAFVHVANTADSSDARPSIAGHGQDTHGGTGWQKGNEGGKKEAEKPSDKSTSKSDKEKKEDKKKNPRKGSSGTGTGAGTGTGGGDAGEAPGSVSASVPTCGASQLATFAAYVNAPDAEGKVYGKFQISNASQMACTIAGSGSVGVQAMGAADPARVNVVDHTSGDAAYGLPDPSLETTGLLLEPGMRYEVQFAWVPTETCPTTGTPPDPTPTQDPGPGPTGGGTGSGDGGSGAATGGGGDAEQTGTEPQLGSEDGGTADGSVVVSHTPAAGGPTPVATITNACAGTVYRTGVLAAS